LTLQDKHNIQKNVLTLSENYLKNQSVCRG
jgi:hypothetical protein